MKSKVFGVGLGSTIFIFLLIATLALVRPVYLRIMDSLSQLEKNLTEELEEKTGLAFSYQSLSPSIFIGVNFRNISIFDAESKSKVIGIKRAHLSYNVMGFFSKNPSVALDELVLNGLSIEYDALQDTRFNSKIKEFLSSGEKESEAKEEKGGESSSKKFTLAGKKFDIPLDVLVKNLSVHYSDKMNDILFTLSSMKVSDFD